MIKAINIHNFQSHKFTALALDPGLNVIVGSTDSGKSSIIRALRWLIWNRPMGDAFRSHWGGGTEVMIETEEAYITRLKEDKANVYFLNEQEFKAVKHDVPESIQQALNMDETNLQQQLDSPFLISSTPGEVATYFNKVAHLDQIDTALATIQKQIRTLTGQITADEGRLQGLELELGQYEYITKFEIELELLEEMNKQQGWRQTSVEDLKYGIGMLTSYNEAIDRLEARQKVLAPVDEILDMYQTRNDLDKVTDGLVDLGNEIQDLDRQMTDMRSELVDMEETFHQYMPEICPLCESEIQTKN